jgi:hypothetical protein
VQKVADPIKRKAGLPNSTCAGTLLNAGDGSFAAIELATPTPLTLSAANPGGVGSGTLLCIWVMRPDGTAARASTRIP